MPRAKTVRGADFLAFIKNGEREEAAARTAAGKVDGRTIHPLGENGSAVDHLERPSSTETEKIDIAKGEDIHVKRNVHREEAGTSPRTSCNEGSANQR